MAVMPWVPFMRARPSLASSTRGSRPQRPSAVAGRQPLAAQVHLAFADHGQRQVGERGQVARGAERALLGHDGEDVVLEHLDKARHDLAPHPGLAEGEDVCPQGQHRPDLLGRELVADGHGVGTQQAVLEGLTVLGCEVHVGESRRNPSSPRRRPPLPRGPPRRRPGRQSTLERTSSLTLAGAPRAIFDDVFDTKRAAEFNRCRRSHELGVLQ